MEIFRQSSALQTYALAARKAGKTIALVPTMGFLHDGHMSLIDIARARADVVIVSIFVNPTQFAPNEDLDKYPRDFEGDVENCRKHGVDVIFAPEPGEMYAENYSVWITEETLSLELCGKSRPIHFRGVCTVVAKLFNLAQCQLAVFGRKDAQQALIIRRMVRDLNFPVEIITAPLVRGGDNLALSSRNRYLSEEEHQNALSISRALLSAEKELLQRGPGVAAELVEKVTGTIADAGGRIDYVKALDGNLEPVTSQSKEVLLAVAAYFGNTRLIDNVYCEFHTESEV